MASIGARQFCYHTLVRAIERGPLVYCLEQADNGDRPIAELEIDPAAPLASRWESSLLEGVVTVRTAGFRVGTASWDRRLYRPFRAEAAAPRERAELTAIPYFAWANREPGPMRVWIPRR